MTFACTDILAQAEHIIEIDRNTGSFKKLCAPIPGVEWVGPEDGVYDENKGVFYFISAYPSPCVCLPGVDITTGALVSSPSTPNMLSFQFDEVTNKLYALKRDIPNGVKYFGSVNPLTGAFTQIGDVLPDASIYQGSLNAFDKTNHRYIFEAPVKKLIALDALTGDVLSAPDLVAPQSEVLHSYVFNNKNGLLYAMLNDNTANESFLVTVDPATGIYMRVGNGTGLGQLNGNGAIDETDNLFMQLHTGNGNYVLTTMDINTAQVILSVQLPLIYNQENAFNLAYDNTRRKALAIHWSASKEDVGLSENSILSSEIFPVPANDEVKISLPSEPNAMIYLYDLSGRQVSNHQTDENGNCVIKKENHAAGLYIVKAMKGETLAYQGKIVFSEE